MTLGNRLTRVTEAAPQLVNDPAASMALANSSLDDDQLVQAAEAIQGDEVIRWHMQQLADLPKAHQNSAWNNLDENTQKLYRSYGYRPVVYRDTSILRKITKGLGTVGNVLDPTDLVEETVEAVTGGMEAASDFMTHSYTFGREVLMDNKRDSAASFSAKWYATANGESYYTAEKQAEIVKIVGENNYDFVISQARGEKPAEYLKRIGWSQQDPNYTTKIQELYELTQDETIMDAVTNLANSKISPGRDLWALMHMGPELSHPFVNLKKEKVAPGWVPVVGDMSHKDFVSGMGDGAFRIFTDPTLILGKINKGYRVGKYGINPEILAHEIEAARSLVIKQATEAGEVPYLAGISPAREAEAATARLFDSSRIRSLQHVRSTRRAAERIALHMKAGTTDRLIREMPGVMHALRSIQEFGELTGKGINTADDVFDFYQTANGLMALSAGRFGRYSFPSEKLLSLPQASPLTAIKGQVKDAIETVVDYGRFTKRGEQVVQRSYWNPSRVAAEGWHGLTNMGPKKEFINPDAPDAIELFRQILAFQLPKGARDDILNQFILSTPNFAFKKSLYNQAVETQAKMAGLFEHETGRTHWNRIMSRQHQTYAALNLDVRKIGGVETRSGIYPNQWANAWQLPDYREWYLATRNQGKHLQTTQRAVDTIHSQIWKPSVLLRIGFIPRAFGEEIVWAIANKGPKALYRGHLANIASRGVDENLTALRPLLAMTRTLHQYAPGALKRAAGPIDVAAETMAKYVTRMVRTGAMNMTEDYIKRGMQHMAEYNHIAMGSFAESWSAQNYTGYGTAAKQPSTFTIQEKTDDGFRELELQRDGYETIEGHIFQSEYGIQRYMARAVERQNDEVGALQYDMTSRWLKPEELDVVRAEVAAVGLPTDDLRRLVPDEVPPEWDNWIKGEHWAQQNMKRLEERLAAGEQLSSKEIEGVRLTYGNVRAELAMGLEEKGLTQEDAYKILGLVDTLPDHYVSALWRRGAELDRHVASSALTRGRKLVDPYHLSPEMSEEFMDELLNMIKLRDEVYPRTANPAHINNDMTDIQYQVGAFGWLTEGNVDLPSLFSVGTDGRPHRAKVNIRNGKVQTGVLIEGDRVIQLYLAPEADPVVLNRLLSDLEEPIHVPPYMLMESMSKADQFVQQVQRFGDNGWTGIGNYLDSALVVGMDEADIAKVTDRIYQKWKARGFEGIQLDDGRGYRLFDDVRTVVTPGQAYYHGTAGISPTGKPLPIHYATGNLYGPGFYTTVDPEIATAYSGKGRGATPTPGEYPGLYKTHWSEPGVEPNLVDLDEPFPPDVAAVLAARSEVHPFDSDLSEAWSYGELRQARLRPLEDLESDRDFIAGLSDNEKARLAVLKKEENELQDAYNDFAGSRGEGAEDPIMYYKGRRIPGEEADKFTEDEATRLMLLQDEIRLLPIEEVLRTIPGGKVMYNLAQQGFHGDLAKEILDELGSMGYHGWTHQGGRLSGGTPHKVAIWWDTEKLGFGQEVRLAKTGVEKARRVVETREKTLIDDFYDAMYAGDTIKAKEIRAQVIKSRLQRGDMAEPLQKADAANYGPDGTPLATPVKKGMHRVYSVSIPETMREAKPGFMPDVDMADADPAFVAMQSDQVSQLGLDAVPGHAWFSSVYEDAKAVAQKYKQTTGEAVTVSYVDVSRKVFNEGRAITRSSVGGGAGGQADVREISQVFLPVEWRTRLDSLPDNPVMIDGQAAPGQSLDSLLDDLVHAQNKDFDHFFADPLNNEDERDLRNLIFQVQKKGELTLDDMDAIPAGHLPEDVMLPRIIAPDTKNFVQKATDKGFDLIGQSGNALVRHPLFMHQYAEALETIGNPLRAMLTDPQLKANLNAIGKKYGMDYNALLNQWYQLPQDVRRAVDPARMAQQFQINMPPKLQGITPRDAQKLNQATEHLKYVEQTIAEAVSERAASSVIPYLDDHRLRSQFQGKHRNLIPFHFAEEQFIKRWVRTVQKDPAVIRKAALTMNGLRHMGIVHENEYGEMVYDVPGSGFFLNAVSRGIELFTGRPAMLPISMPFTGAVKLSVPGTDRIGIPSLGPMVGLGLSVIHSVFPEIADNSVLRSAEKLAYGERGMGRTVPQQLVPSSMMKLYDAIIATPESDQHMASAMMEAMAYMEANDLGPGPDADGITKKNYMSRVKNWARAIMLTRAVLSFSTPAPPTPDMPDELNERFKELLKEMPYQEAFGQFMSENPDGQAFSVFQTENVSGAPLIPSEKALVTLREDSPFYAKYQDAGPWFLPQSLGEDQFSRAAWYETLANAMRRQKTPEAFLRDIYFAEAAETYFDEREAYDLALEQAQGNKEWTKQIKASFSEWRDAYFVQHPTFAEDLASNEAKNRRQRTISQIREAFSDPLNPVPEHQEELRTMVDEYTIMRASLVEWKGDPTKRGREMREHIKDTFSLWANVYARKTPSVTAFFNTVIKPDLD